MTDLVQKALQFATDAHKDQMRKYTHEPYIVHPKAVADMVADTDATQEQVAAALLHDVVEDTQFTLEDIKLEFGDTVADLVFWLTDVDHSHGNRKQRKQKDRDRLSQAPAQAQIIKVADFIDNTKSIVEHDPKFAKLYLQEKMDMLAVLTKVKDTDLWKKASIQINVNFLK